VTAGIEVVDLTYTYPAADTPALRGVTLRVEPGTLCAVVGPNGGGKTTLCHAVRGFVPHFFGGELTGTVRVGGLDVSSAGEDTLARNVGYLFQNPFTQMSGITDTVFDEIAFGLGNLGVPAPEIRDRVDQALTDARLTDLAGRHPYELSGGQQQRVALASVLVMDQPVLVVDEPTSQLDPRTRQDVFELLLRARSSGRTILLVEHTTGLLARHADRMVVLDDGEVAVAGTPEDVVADVRTTAHGVDLPPVVRLADGLRERGIDVGTHLSVESLAEALAPRVSAVSVGAGRPGREDRDLAARQPDPAGRSPEPILRIDDVSYSYPGGTRAVDRVSLTVTAGESVAVVGQNGAGKTTTVKMMNGLVRPASGTVTVAGEDTARRTTAQVSRRVGYVFQNPDDQIFHQTVRAELRYGLKRTKLPEAERDRRVHEAAELTGLTAVLEENPHDLPLSVRTFVTIASVLAADPDVVVLDEPTAGQDRAGLDRLARILDHLTGRGRAVVTITHDMEFLAGRIGRVVVMARGRVVADGSPDEIFTDADALAAAWLAPPAAVDLAARLGLATSGLDLDAVAAALHKDDESANE